MASPVKSRSPGLRFHAVSIVPGPVACPQVKALKNARLLSLEAPRLPVVGCTNPGGCHCRFQHHDDRRAGPRRTGLGKSTQGTWSADDNRRHSAGRRDSDYADG